MFRHGCGDFPTFACSSGFLKETRRRSDAATRVENVVIQTYARAMPEYTFC
jgi:hypothetical protein